MIVALLACMLAASPAYAADVGSYDTDIDGQGTIAVDVEGNAIAVGGDPPYELVFRYRHVKGRWSQQYRLPGDLYALDSDSIAASGRAGMAVAVGQTRSSGRVAATIRRTDATWTTPYTLNSGLAGRATGADVAANPDGDYAVSWTQMVATDDLRTYIAVRQRGGTWRRFAMGAISLGPTQVGIDAAGNATIAWLVRSSQTDPARLVARRKPVSGPREATFQVSRGGDDVGTEPGMFEQVIERTGRRTYAYRVAYDFSDPFATGRVLRQQIVGGPLVQVWSNDATRDLSIAADGGRLRVVWIEQADDAASEVAMTQAFNPTAGAPVEIADAPEDPISTGVAINRYGVGVLTVGKGFRSSDERAPTARAHHVTAGNVGPGDWIDEENPHWDNYLGAAKPLLGPGKEYFIGSNSAFGLPAGYIGTLLVFRGTLP